MWTRRKTKSCSYLHSSCALIFAEEGSKQNRLKSPERLFSLDEESMGHVLARLDKHQDESRVYTITLSSLCSCRRLETRPRLSMAAGGEHRVDAEDA